MEQRGTSQKRGAGQRLSAVLAVCIGLMAGWPFTAAAGESGGLPLRAVGVTALNAIDYGMPLQAVSLGGSFWDDATWIFGDLVWDEPGRILPAGTHEEIPCTFTAWDSRYAPWHGTVSVTVNRVPLTVVGAVIADKEYDGGYTARVEQFALQGLVAGDGVEVVAEALFGDPAAGPGKEVKIRPCSLEGPAAGNYTLAKNMVLATGNIRKYSSAICPAVHIALKAGAATSKTLRLSDYIVLEGPGNPGEIHYGSDLDVRGDPGVFSAQPTLQDGLLQFKTAEGTEQGQIAEVRFAVRSENYADVTASIRFVVGKEAVAVTGVTVESKTYDGEPVAPEGTPTAGGAPLAGAVYRYTGRRSTAYDSVGPPRDAGDYRLVVSAPDNHPSLTGVSAPLDFAIHKARLTIIPLDVELPEGAEPPAQFALRYEGFFPGDGPDEISPPPVAVLNEDGCTIRLEGTYEARNYEVVAATGTLTYRNESSGPENPNPPDPGEDQSTSESPTPSGPDTQTKPASSVSGNNSSGRTTGSSIPDGESGFWASVNSRVLAAAEGSTLRIVMTGDRIPAELLDALRGRDVTLHLVRPGGDIALNGRNIPPLGDAASITVQELAALLLSARPIATIPGGDVPAAPAPAESVAGVAKGASVALFAPPSDASSDLPGNGGEQEESAAALLSGTPAGSVKTGPSTETRAAMTGASPDSAAAIPPAVSGGKTARASPGLVAVALSVLLGTAAVGAVAVAVVTQLRGQE